MLDLKQLQCFLAVAEQGHFGKAAASLNMTQSPLSRQIQNLENSLKVKLFDRTTRAVSLTPSGRVFFSEAARIVALVESATLNVRRAAVGEGGTVRIGFTAAIAFDFLPRLMKASQLHLTDTSFILNDMHTREQAEGIMTGEIDVAFMRTSKRQDGIKSVRLTTESLVAVLPEDSRLAQKSQIDLIDFEDLPFVAYSPLGEGHLQPMIDLMFRRVNVSPNYVQYVRSIGAVLSLVQAGVGHGLAPQSVASVRRNGVVYRELVRTQANEKYGMYMCWREDEAMPAISRFTDIAIEEAKAWHPPRCLTSALIEQI